jgi:sterol desaturase/sphingolipid hydroxylase (fatty acid hydroxylase superfamily)
MDLAFHLLLWLRHVATIVAQPFLFVVTPRERIYWVYLVTSLLPCVAFCVTRARGGRRPSLGAVWRYCFPRRIFLHRSARIDYVYFVVNTIAMAVALGTLTISQHEVYRATLSRLTAWGFAPATAMTRPHVVATLIVTGLSALAMDFGLFLAHYNQHKIPLLWQFHKVHHSAEVLTPITVYRMHPIDDVVVGLFAGVLGGLTPALLGVFVFPGVHAVELFGLNPVFFLSYLGLYHLRHSHFWLPYPTWLSHVLVSPAQHQIHHSKDPRHFDKNIGFIFAFWDWLFGTLYVPKVRERLVFGLAGDEDREFSSVARLYLVPFRKAAAMLRRPVVARVPSP